MLMSLFARLFFASCTSVRLSSACLMAPSMSIACGVNDISSVGSMRRVQKSGDRRVEDQRAQAIFGLLDGGLGDDHRFLVARHLGLRFDDVDGRHGADLDALLVVGEERAWPGPATAAAPSGCRAE